jgi:tetratricopeptide (TPR) repeat protein
MQSTIRYLSIVAAAASLLACGSTSYHVPPATAIASPGFSSADDAYLVGRGQHLSMRYADAVRSYEAALKIAPAHANASNGLATLYAERGEFDKAIPLWQALTAPLAEQAGPESAFLFSNLGYALFLKGDHQAALQALEKACVLDPLNHRAWRHLGSALEKLGQLERAQQMYKQAAALENHDFKADYAIAPNAGIAAIDSAVAAADENWARTELEQTAGGMFIMRRVEARKKPLAPGLAAPAAPVAAIAAPPAAALIDANTQLEIRNGNGVTGMARALAGTLGGAEMLVVRLTNEKGFGVQRTRVEYQPEFREAAERLAARFGAARAVQVDDVSRADVRLVLGRDLVPVKLARTAGVAAPLALTANKALADKRG